MPIIVVLDLCKDKNSKVIIYTCMPLTWKLCLGRTLRPFAAPPRPPSSLPSIVIERSWYLEQRTMMKEHGLRSLTKIFKAS
jgi:hypothetical protein